VTLLWGLYQGDWESGKLSWLRLLVWKGESGSRLWQLLVGSSQLSKVVNISHRRRAEMPLVFAVEMRCVFVAKATITLTT